MMIQKISENEYLQTYRGNEMTLIRYSDGWRMYTVNAMVRAYRNGYAAGKYFASLTAVEKHYKSWRGISVLAN